MRQQAGLSPRRLAKSAALVALLMLAGVFAWYFRGHVPVDLALWWAACFSP